MSNKQKKDIAPVDTPETPTEDIAPVDTPETPTEDIAPVDTPADGSEGTDVGAESNDNAPIEEVRTFVEGQFTVKANLKRNGKRYSVGESITLDEDEAKTFLADGTVE